MVLAPFISEEECMKLVRECPALLGFLLDALEHARSQPDHYTAMYTTRYHADTFLRLVAALCGASDQVITLFVESGLITQLNASFASDPTKFASEIHFAALSLWHILLVENGKFSEPTRKEPNLVSSMRTFFLSRSFLILSSNLFNF